MILTFAVNQELSIAFAVISVMAVWMLLALYLPMLSRLRRALCRKGSEASADRLPVSVVVYTYANSKGLSKVIKRLYEQEYDAPKEIIVVNDGKDNGVEDFLTIASTRYLDLRSTFTPHDTRNISRKKLALTLGIKAARYPVVMLLTSESRIPGSHWLSAMAAPFSNDRIGLVLGYAGPGDTDVKRGLLSRGMRHDILLGDIEWLGDALDGAAWRADGDNMGLRRSMFFERMGFGNSLNLQYGDDDVFISDSATASNTAVVLVPEAIAVTEAPDDMPAYYRFKRERHAMMDAYCTRRPSMRITFEYVIPWIWLLASVAASVLGLLNIADAFDPANIALTCSVLGAVVLAAVALWISLGVAFSRVSVLLAGRRLRWGVIGMLLSRPVRRWRWRPRKAPRSWQRPC